MMNKKFCIFTIVLAFFVLYGFSQTRTDLELQKKDSYEKIQYTNSLLKETQKTKTTTFNQLVLLNKKIEVRNEIIDNYSKEIEILNKRIIDNQEVIISLNDDLQKLKKDYENIIINSYKNRRKYEKLMFILSSKDFNQAYRRVRYMKEYTDFRHKQADIIIATTHKIEETLAKLELERAEKNELIIDKEKEKEVLNSDVGERQKLIQKLKSKEKELKTEIAKQERIAKDLQSKIEEIIAEEARKAAERSKGTKGSAGMLLTPEEKLISDEFGKNKTYLPWPTERGIITDNFGEHYHPVLKGVLVRNDGIDISTSENAVARAIFKGEVSRVFAIPGANKAVIIRHGNYLTVYSNLKDVIVKPGQMVDTKQAIGVVYSDKTDNLKTILKFQIWKESAKMNPQEWLAKSIK